MSTFGALEYDPDIFNVSAEEKKDEEPQSKHNGNEEPKKNFKHREFLKEEVKFKEVVNLDDESIVERIHFIYRLTYLKDTAIARFIEDSAI